MKKKVVDFYQNHYDEKGRLLRDSRNIEFVRTQEIIQRYIPKSPARVLDVGGGAGIYSAWLARRGYEVRLVDIVPLHVDQAKETSQKQPDHPFTAEVGDATNLSQKDGSYNVVLLLGPLYHLVDRKERDKALCEAWRVLKPAGLLFVAAIGRFAGIIDGMKTGSLNDPKFKSLVERDLRSGKHLPESHKYFTEAYFHHPNELQEEIAENNFKLEGLFGVEGPAGVLPDEEVTKRWRSKEKREQLLYTARKLEQEPSVLGVSCHLLAVARK